MEGEWQQKEGLRWELTFTQVVIAVPNPSNCCTKRTKAEINRSSNTEYFEGLSYCLNFLFIQILVWVCMNSVLLHTHAHTRHTKQHWRGLCRLEFQRKGSPSTRANLALETLCMPEHPDTTRLKKIEWKHVDSVFIIYLNASADLIMDN